MCAFGALGGFDGGRREGAEQRREPGRREAGVNRQDRRTAPVQRGGEQVHQPLGAGRGRQQHCVQGPAVHRRRVNRADQASNREGARVIDWQRAAGLEYTDIGYETAEGIAKITINRPEVRNAFRPTTLFELSHAFTAARDDPGIGVIIFTGAGTESFCSGGDQKIRGDDGYVDASGVGRAMYSPPTSTSTIENNVFYPPADSAAVATDRIAATNDGLHILGATVTTTPAMLSDLHVEIPAGNANGPSVTITCPTTGTLSFSNTVSPTLLNQITATAITGVVPASDSSIAFVTYTGSGGVLPAYAPVSGTGAGTTTYIKLSGTATAPLAGVISSDNTIVYVGTAGDNLVHLINRTTLTDSSTLAPNLTSPAGVAVPVNLLVQKPRKTT